MQVLGVHLRLGLISQGAHTPHRPWAPHFTSKVKPGFTLRNFEQIIANPAYASTSLRTLGIALAVTVLSILISVPLGIFMAKVASPKLRAILAVAITLPLWAGYLVKILAMRITFTEEGFFNSMLGPLGISGPGFSIVTVVLTLTYLWLPSSSVKALSRSMPRASRATQRLLREACAGARQGGGVRSSSSMAVG